MSNTKICPDCNGNGYIGNSRVIDEQKDCDTCMNQGLIMVDLQWEHLWNTAQFQTEKK